MHSFTVFQLNFLNLGRPVKYSHFTLFSCVMFNVTNTRDHREQLKAAHHKLQQTAPS